MPRCVLRLSPPFTSIASSGLMPACVQKGWGRLFAERVEDLFDAVEFDLVDLFHEPAKFAAG